MPRIKGLIVQSDGSKPHVVFIMTALANAFPNVIWKIGGKVNRTTWGGGFSAHSAGRACDIYLDANDPLDRKLGDLLFNLFIDQANILKVDHTIWNGQWSDSGSPATAYTGSGGPHKDHVHVAFADHHLEVLPYIFHWYLGKLASAYVTGNDGAADRQDGLYGQAFNTRTPNVRLSRDQRKKIMLRNMGMQGADL